MALCRTAVGPHGDSTRRRHTRPSPLDHVLRPLQLVDRIRQLRTRTQEESRGAQRGRRQRCKRRAGQVSGVRAARAPTATALPTVRQEHDATRQAACAIAGSRPRATRARHEPDEATHNGRWRLSHLIAQLNQVAVLWLLDEHLEDAVPVGGARLEGGLEVGRRVLVRRRAAARPALCAWVVACLVARLCSLGRWLSSFGRLLAGGGGGGLARRGRAAGGRDRGRLRRPVARPGRTRQRKASERQHMVQGVCVCVLPRGPAAGARSVRAVASGGWWRQTGLEVAAWHGAPSRGPPPASGHSAGRFGGSKRRRKFGQAKFTGRASGHRRRRSTRRTGRT